VINPQGIFSLLLVFSARESNKKIRGGKNAKMEKVLEMKTPQH